MHRQYLFIMLGIPGSGKSTFAGQLAGKDGFVRLNSDAMRLAIFKSREETDRIYHSEVRATLNTYTFGALNYAVLAALQAGSSVIYDACNNTQIERREIAEAVPHDFTPITVWVKTPQDIAVQRAVERRESSTDRKLSSDEASKYIEKIAREIEPPVGEEAVIVIDGMTSFEEQYRSFKEQLKDISR